MSRPSPVIACLTAAALAACAGGSASSGAPRSTIPAVAGDTLRANGVRYVEVAAGTGAPVERGRCVAIHYRGWLADGTAIDSSRDTLPGGALMPPVTFTLGRGDVIGGWERGIQGMRVGGRRRLFIPHQLGYGERGSPPRIPPYSPLVFDVEVVEVRERC